MSARRLIPGLSGSPVGAPPLVSIASGIVLVVAAFLPWYTANVAPPFTPGDSSGWKATVIARVALALGVVVAGAALAAVLDEREVLPLSDRAGDALGWIVVIAAAAAAVLVGYRVLVMPGPAEFLSRQIGLYLAMAAAVGGVLGGLALVATRR
ncbi:MAG: hypothetical protein AB7V42_10010 [Thermoleophilia bacterium]